MLIIAQYSLLHPLPLCWNWIEPSIYISPSTVFSSQTLIHAPPLLSIHKLKYSWSRVAIVHIGRLKHEWMYGLSTKKMAIAERWPLVEVQLFYSPLFIQSSNKQLLCYLIFCLQVICCIYLSTGGMLFAHMTHPILPSTCGLDCSTMKINFKRQGFLKILTLLRYFLHLQS